MARRQRGSEEILHLPKMPEETCPLINKCQETLESLKTEKNKKKIDKLISTTFEKIRDANMSLRCWGYAFKDLTKELLDKYEPGWRTKRGGRRGKKDHNSFKVWMRNKEE